MTRNVCDTIIGVSAFVAAIGLIVIPATSKIIFSSNATLFGIIGILSLTTTVAIADLLTHGVKGNFRWVLFGLFVLILPVQIFFGCLVLGGLIINGLWPPLPN